jgi:hypothetical protein
MFGIVWMREQAEIARESCGLSRPDDVVRYARAKARIGTLYRPGSEPDEFRVVDASGEEIARQPLVTRRPQVAQQPER